MHMDCLTRARATRAQPTRARATRAQPTRAQPTRARFSRTRPAWAATGLVVAAMLAGCAGKSSSASSATSGTTGVTVAATPASTATVAAATDPKLGPIVTDSGGETLYVFDGDKAGQIGCTGACATLWLPVTLELGQASPTGSGVSAPLGTVTRAEGPQVTLGGRPLYTYSKDTPGQSTGDGVGGKWHVAKPGGNPIVATPAATTGRY